MKNKKNENESESKNSIGYIILDCNVKTLQSRIDSLLRLFQQQAYELSENEDYASTAFDICSILLDLLQELNEQIEKMLEIIKVLPDFAENLHLQETTSGDKSIGVN